MRNNVGLFLTKRAQLQPSVEGFIDADTRRRFTFEEWNARSNRTASALRAEGVRKGDRVALLQMNSIEYIETFFALAKLGAVCVPLNWRLVPEELSFILRDAGAATLLFGSEFLGPAEDLKRRGRGEDGTAIERWIQVGAGADRPNWALSYDALQSAASDAEPEIASGEDDLLYIMYTSGTTGLPKGAVHTHDTAIWSVLTINATVDLRAGDRYLVSLPLFHVGALTPLTSNVHRGVTSVVMRSFDAKRSWDLIASEAITVALKVPSMLNFMLQVHDPALQAGSQLRWILSGAAPVPVSLIEAYAKIGIEIHQIYGLTESCGPACVISAADALRKAGSTGKAFFHTDVRVVEEGGRDVVPGQSGEVIVRGRHIMKGYWNRPEATAQTIVDGWLRSGDVATVDDEGFVYIQDRIKDMIISGGENVYPAEVESVLMRHPQIVEAAVIGAPSAKWGESPVAIVVPRGDGLDAASVVSFCKDKLARFKQPVTVHFIDQIPRNPSGKILKRVLREKFPGPAPQ